jgi:hypothetical protein
VNSTTLTACLDLGSIVAMTFTLDAVLNVLKLEDTESRCVEKYVCVIVGGIRT